MQEMEQTQQTPEAAITVETAAEDNVKNVSIGKFADSDALLKAYNNLEAEFTKKCQQLKAVEGELSGKSAQPVTPMYEMDDWNKKVEDFESANPIAKKYAKEISEAIKSDADLAKDNRCLEIALMKVLTDKANQPESIMEDEAFIDAYVVNNDKVKSKIIANYLDSLSELDSTPSLGNGGAVTILPPTKIRTIEEAGILAEKILNNRRI